MPAKAGETKFSSIASELPIHLTQTNFASASRTFDQHNSERPTI
jgi:hypothetical protein